MKYDYILEPFAFADVEVSDRSLGVTTPIGRFINRTG